MSAERPWRWLGLALVAAAFAAPAVAASRSLPVPAEVIYPGEKITDAMLTDAPVSQLSETPYDAVRSRAALIGEVARRTLLPGRPIASIAVEKPRLVSVGAEVRLVYRQGGLSIATTAQALQNGCAGQIVQVRNLDSGIVVTGSVQPDGSVRVSGG